jgi:alpha-glucosidase
MIAFQKLLAAKAVGHRAQFELDDGFSLRIALLAADLVRVSVVPPGGFPTPKSWTVAPDGDVPWEGRARDGDAGFLCPPVVLSNEAEAWIVAGSNVRVVVLQAPLRLRFERRVEGGPWQTVIEDRESGAYLRCDEGLRLRHYQARDGSERYFGLGDKTGPIDRAGRRFRMIQLDALGYDAENGDPLYKHFPFFAVDNGKGAWAGLYYDTLAPLTVDLGNERSNYHGLYRYVEADEAALDFYVSFGAGLPDIVEGFARLTGLPHQAPRWAYGFAFTSMHHADDANAQAKIAAFAERCRKDGIPISSIHFGSGYSSRGKRRYVFTWNREKFPDPKALFAKLRAMSLKTVANLKPVLIDDHPAYAGLASDGGFLQTPDGAPVVEQFWDGHGSFLDFTNEKTVAWWQDGFERQVLDVGFDCGWNDNNEYEAWREGASGRGFGTPIAVSASRPLHALLMSRATFEASARRNPDKRPYTITRAGPPGIQRYAETWSGDNFTSWHTLKWNLRNGLSMALSGMGKIGHDIGGFAGPRPDPELLCRWVEMMALHPRALMNSWKPDVGEATEPWTHPSVLDAVREALRLRYRFLPLLYTRGYLGAAFGVPSMVPLLYHYDDDPHARGEHDSFLIGPDILVAPVVMPGARRVRVYLPKGPQGWADFHTGALYPAGAFVDVDAPLGRPPVFVRVGAVLALASPDIPAVLPHEAPARHLYAVAGTSIGKSLAPSLHFEDDGESWSLRTGDYLAMASTLEWSSSEVRVALARANGDRPVPRTEAFTIEVVGLAGRTLVR